MARITVPTVRFRQNGYWIYLTSLKAANLKDFTQVAHFRADRNPSDPQQGYQREPVPAKVKSVAKYLHEQNRIMPTAIVMSAREGHSAVDFDESRREITLDSGKRLYIIDGQHRAGGFRYGIEDREWTELADFEVPVVIVQGLDKTEEMRQFRDINGNQKRVSTSLVNMILTQIESAQGEDAIPEKDRWKVVATLVISRLCADDDSPWKDLIIMPNESRPSRAEVEEHPELANKRMTSATSFYAATRPIYEYLKEHHDYLMGATVESEAEVMYAVLVQFWQAVKELCPQAFETPADYVIQKTPGLFALNMVCKALLAKMHSARREWVKEQFKVMLDGAQSTTDAGFWKVGDPDVGDGGEAAKYGSMKGFSDLSKLILGDLEESPRAPAMR
ncbi:MAG: DGQHR domain-containing protein [Candidatus Omnitrophica bacterium]|nr:DGQHR domain-containing protein [Candidatus Omnitrophota bacterium]